MMNEVRSEMNECMACGRRDQNVANLMRNKRAFYDLLFEGRNLVFSNRCDDAQPILQKAEGLSRQVYQKDCPELVEIKLRLFYCNRMKSQPDFDAAFRYGREILALEKKFPSGLYPCRVLEPLMLLNVMFMSQEWVKRGQEAHVVRMKFLQESKTTFQRIDAMDLKLINSGALQLYSKARDLFALGTQ
jgi:hypothetical protein